MGRESEQADISGTLWDEIEAAPASKANRFRHKITGTSSQTPDDMLGGILADDMGLGKTLVMIATIVSTISQAMEFSSAHRLANNQDTTELKITVMATLIIVPSECQYTCGQ